MLTVSLITYPVPHAKTTEVFFRLWLRSCFKLSFTIVPFNPRPQRNTLFQHRPDQSQGIAPDVLASQYDLPVFSIEEFASHSKSTDWFLVCGAGLLGNDVVGTRKIINAHPGLIPQSRGLDAFKWAIVRNCLIGNTLHVIDEGVDLGHLLHHQATPVFSADTLQTFAARHYEFEVDLLTRFDEYLSGGRVMSLPIAEPTKRMPSAIEADLDRHFKAYKEHWGIWHDRSQPGCARQLTETDR